VTSAIDVAELAEQVRVPTLVLQPRGQAGAVREGRLIAARIPGARFVRSRPGTTP
jgi:hypothetical protein